MDGGDLEHQGLSNTEALAILHDQLSALLSDHKKRQKERTWKVIWRSSFLHHSNRWSSFHWPGALLLVLATIALAGCHHIQPPKRTPEFGMNDFCHELYNPPLDSISLQWTYRDGQLVNLPTSMLVEGDIIALRPGQKAPTSLRGIEDEEHVILDRDDIFCQFSSPPSPIQKKKSHTHSLLKPHPFRVTKTPIVGNIQRCLELGQERPVTVLNNERFTAQRLLEKYIAPMVLVVLLIINGLRFVIGAPGIGSWQVTLLQLQVNGVLPLLPLSFPILWFLVNAYGEARMVALLLKPTANFKENWIETWRMFWATVRGNAPALSQTSSLLHNLGSITVLCCVDKQGILSWPSSCPDKVFFFTDSWCRAKPQDENLTASISLKTAPSARYTVQRGSEHPELPSDAVMVDHQTNFAVEMLSLSQDQQDPTHIWFDDSNWQQHSASLKPLGLGILLGLCDPTSAARVFQMTDHLSHIALTKSRCLPVQLSAGLCELPRIIGFTSSARNLFHKQTYTAVYTSTTMTNTQEASPWEPSFITKRKLPLSHMINLLAHTSNSGSEGLKECTYHLSYFLTFATFLRKRSVIGTQHCYGVQENHKTMSLLLTELMQLFSYGSAGTILDACSEFWDGNDICPLSRCARKKIFDFYRHACLTGECIALSYKPVFHTLHPSDDEKCLQVPLKNKHCGQTDTSAALDLDELTFDQEDNLHPLGDQILLGLISSQYQARLDMVHLIDGLDDSCIRFVYFSLEDELKSKEFAEKMGLETGWNCHISLQSNGFVLDPDHLTPSSQNIVDQQDSENQRLMREDGSLLETDEERMPGSNTCSFIDDLNRAKLPRGIENIRPHLEHVDNVPLLVPLFTDCTAETMCEMVRIMQEYGEVVCCLGSSLNSRNIGIFLQSDISFSLDPLSPSCCRQTCHKDCEHLTLCSQKTTPVYLSSLFGSLASSVHFRNHGNISIIELIKQARQMSSGIRKCFLLQLQCQLSLTMIQVLASLAQLPPPLGTTDVLCLTCVYFPLVSMSLMGKPPDNTVMKVATGKNLKILPKKTQWFFVLYFLVKSGLTVCLQLTCFGLMLHGFCMKELPKTNFSCHPFGPFMNPSYVSPNWFEEFWDALILAQKIVAFFILLHGLCTSMSHVHRSNPLWKQSPLSNRWWCAAVIIAFLLHVIQINVAYYIWDNKSSHLVFHILDIPSATWLLGFLWLFPLMVINEFLKLHEIRMRMHYQKKQKLQFDTKLGMNSPF
ncbi:transmembrane protein 94-like [Stegostoma tigrinum]|uniref:transmembrane protein 94-like n=1 Tax=Stegostoma tigrinum TaxID=3053191 RepID=UPI0028701B29|nr:transmembrane protein 94-like [Stegostoma tigrinum]